MKKGKKKQFLSVDKLNNKLKDDQLGIVCFSM